VDPDWPDQQNAVSAANDMARNMFTEWITSQIDGDSELLAKVIPDYPATGKRTLQDNGSWLKTLTKEHVELVRDGVDHIERDTVVGSDGRRYPADVLIYATGFRVNDLISSLKVVGRNGIDLPTAWGPRPAAAGPSDPHRLEDDAAPAEPLRRLVRLLASRDANPGLVTAEHHAQLLQGRRRQGPRTESMTARRLLGVAPPSALQPPAGDKLPQHNIISAGSHKSARPPPTV